MSMYLEIPEFESEFRFRTFLNDGLTIVYPHVHKEIEIIYAKRGTVNIGVDDTIIELKEGDLYLFPAGSPTTFLHHLRVNAMSINLICSFLKSRCCEKMKYP